MKKQIPNALTASNLVFGMLSIISTYNAEYFLAAVFIIIAMIADGLDGRAARYFKVSSEFGKELDSLCDLVSFGVAPAFLAYAYSLHDLGYVGMAGAVFFATCGALRLARFNVNTTVVKGFFMGLPIPAGGCLIATFILTGAMPKVEFLTIAVVLVGYLMVSTVRYPDFKGKGEKIKKIPVLITAFFAIYILFWNVKAVLFMIFSAYVVFGILNTLM